jgi:NADPH:quinone reductase-like Zn-dependent oxidoreductase
VSPFVDQEIIMLLAQLRQDDLEVMAEFMRAGEVKAIIDRHYSLAEVPEAIRYSESGRARGKIIIDVTDE